jgi:hypothetical protein
MRNCNRTPVKVPWYGVVVAVPSGIWSGVRAVKYHAGHFAILKMGLFANAFS